MTQTSARVRMSPDDRRAQLLELGVGLLATRNLDEVTIDLLAVEAGISRGLLYHYFGNKQEFHEAIVERAVDDLIEVTAPVDLPGMGERMLVSLDRYVGFVESNHRGYVSLRRAAFGGNPRMWELYDGARRALTDRIFDSAGPDGLAELGIADTVGVRLAVRAWAAYAEDAVLAWVDDPRGIARDDLLASLAGALVAVAGTAPPVR